LQEQIDKRISQEQISKKANCDILTVRKYIKKYNIEVCYRKKDWLYEQYWKNELSLSEIGKLVNCDRTVISRWMKRNNLRVRSHSERTMGSKNGNYGNKWSDEQKRIRGERTSKIMKDPEIRYKCGSANRGKKFSKELIEKMHKHRPAESYSHTYSEETRNLIGKLSKEKFTDEYNKRIRSLMEERGWWIPLEEKADFSIYYQKANWVEKMFNRCNKEEESLLKEYGVFNPFTNNIGVVRDHMYSRRSGFKEKVFPKILRHPENCSLILNTENISKISRIKNNNTQHRSSNGQFYQDTNSVSREELFNLIKNYRKEWKEQEECLELIKKYEEGKRWIR